MAMIGQIILFLRQIVILLPSLLITWKLLHVKYPVYFLRNVIKTFEPPYFVQIKIIIALIFVLETT